MFSNLFSEYRAVYEAMLKNVAQRPQTINNGACAFHTRRRTLIPTHTPARINARAHTHM
jgi:hypothetical protein